MATVTRHPPASKAPALAAKETSHRIVVATIDELEAFVPAWDKLAAAALVANPFYEAWMLRPALRAFADPRTFRAILVFRNSPNAATDLTGLFPCEQFRRWHGLPCRGLTLWKHLHGVLSTPLLYRDSARETLGAFLDWAGLDAEGAALLDFDLVDAERAFGQILTDVINERSLVNTVEDQFNRAFLRPRGSTDEYLAAALGARHRQEYRRLRRRLGEQGKLETRVLQSGESLDAWLDRFFHLEAKGWKGSERTALATHPNEEEFFRAIVENAHRSGRLHMLGLFLDDRPIAMKCDFLAGGGAFALKIAYDEEFAKFSPGVLLELDAIDDVHRSADIGWMDSCACANHPMIDRLWVDRRALQRRVISTGGRWGNLTLGLTELGRALKRSVRRRR